MVGRRKIRDIVREAYEASKALPGMLVESLLKEAVDELEAETFWGSEIESVMVEFVVIERRQDGAVVRKHREVKILDSNLFAMNQLRPHARVGEGDVFITISGMVKGSQSEVIVDNSSKLADITPMSKEEAVMWVSVEERDAKHPIPAALGITAEKVANVTTIRAYWKDRPKKEFVVTDQEVLSEAEKFMLRVNDFCSEVGIACDIHPAAVKKALSREVSRVWENVRK